MYSVPPGIYFVSDTLGLSALVGLMSDARTPGVHTDASLLGPFYRMNSPEFKLGDSIAKQTKGTEIVMYGRVVDSNGKGLPGASVQVWQTDEKGDYDLQRPNAATEMDLRGTSPHRRGRPLLFSYRDSRRLLDSHGWSGG